MEMDQRRPEAARSATGILPVALLLLTGCSLTPGKSLTLFPEGHRLIDAAKELKQAATEPQPLPRELEKRNLPPYYVEPGDTLLVQPANLDSPVRLPTDQPVLQDGTIDLGVYGQVVVSGRTTAEIQTIVRAAVEAKTKDAGPINVRLITRISKVYYVLGEVNAPGTFPLQGRETVLDAILAAGGLTDRASRQNIILSRPSPPNACRTVLPICYSEIVQLGDTSTNYQIAPGDRVYVPTRTFWEELAHGKKTCPPCGGPQTPCPSATFGCSPAFSVSLGSPTAEKPAPANEH